MAEKARRAAKECDMAWLKDYKEPESPAKPTASEPSTSKPGTKP